MSGIEIIMADDPNNNDLQEFKNGMAELAKMTPEERAKDARWILMNYLMTNPLPEGCMGFIPGDKK